MTDQGTLNLPIPRSRPRFPAEPIVRSAEIEDNYRWTATRAWGAGPCVHWNLLNPSTADGKRDDPTMRRMIGFSFRWGFGSLVVTNVYPFIASSTKALDRWRCAWSHHAPATGPDHSARDAWLRNVHIVGGVIERTDVHVAAWGGGADDGDLRDFLENARPRIDTSEHDGFGRVQVSVEWMCIGKNADGSPTHPLARGHHYFRNDAVLQTWRAL